MFAPYFQLTDEERSQCEAIFRKYDRDGRGSISILDSLRVLTEMGYTPTEADLSQLLSVTLRSLRVAIALKKFELKAREAFDAFDKDGDGVIGRQDLRRTLRRLGLTPSDPELDMMFTAAGATGREITRGCFVELLADVLSDDLKQSVVLANVDANAKAGERGNPTTRAELGRGGVKRRC